VTIVAAGGYTSVSEVPQLAKQAIHMLVGHWYANRETVITGTISKEVELSYRALLSRIAWGGYA
jgi:hypothetical protein